MKTYTEEELRKMIPTVSVEQQRVIQLYDGNHWLSGDGWIGPRLSTADPYYGYMLNEVERNFISQNVIKEVIDRQVAGLVGIPPDFTVTVKRTLVENEVPTEEEQLRIDQANGWLQRWWSSAQGLAGAEDQLWTPYKIIRRALATGLQIGRAPLRVFLPTDRWTQEEDAKQVNLPVLSEEEALEAVFLHFPEPEQAEVHVDHSTLRIVGIYVATMDNGNMRDYEVHSIEGKKAVVQKYSDGVFQAETSIDLSNHPLMYEVGLTEMIDHSIISQQLAINMALTMLGRNSVQAGFLERIILNGQLPGKDVIDPATGETRFEPGEFQVGPGLTTFVPGLQTEDANGNRSYTNPAVVYRDPVSVDTFTVSVSHLYSNILHSVHQEHVLLGDSDASGESRKQSRADFESALNDEQESVRSALQWLLETVMHMIALLTNQPNILDDLQVSVETHTNLGPLSSAEMDSIIKVVEAKLLSRRSGRVRIGVRDIDAEEEQIRAEEEENGGLEQAALADALMRRSRNVPVTSTSEEDDTLRSDGTEQGIDAVNVQRAGVLE